MIKFVHTKGVSPTLVARTAKHQILPNGGVVLLEPAVYVQFQGAMAFLDENDPDFEVKLDACQRADFVVQVGEDPSAKMEVSVGEPVAQSPVVAAGPLGAASGPPRLTVPVGTRKRGKELRPPTHPPEGD